MSIVNVTCPQKSNNDSESVFLAGGISNCPDWQTEFIKLIEAGYKRDYDWQLVNPRRTSFNIEEEDESKFQIGWERDELEKADIIIFWFPKETLCPITLFELGYWLGHKHIIIGIEPEYQRKLDVEVQARLTEPDITIVYDLDSLAKELLKYL